MKRFVITAGPTREYIDTVRFLTNASTGRTGYEIAREAARRGNEVVLVTGPTSLQPPPACRVTAVESAAEMAGAVLQNLPAADVVIGTAAVCDWRPEHRSPQKLAKQGGALEVQWVRTPDIIRLVGEQKGDRLVIGFALEDARPREKAAEKLQAKNLDYIVLNGPENLGSSGGTYELLARGGRSWSLGYLTKTDLASLLVDLALDGDLPVK